ncbi:MAG: septal ring lytic transglycosylase RlpA family protein [Betaproteobacteria bacterium]|nr:septal ring lytic transglycosylase RlpA family protein [Betaproteobacteria bacterium]
MLRETLPPPPGRGRLQARCARLLRGALIVPRRGCSLRERAVSPWGGPAARLLGYVVTLWLVACGGVPHRPAPERAEPHGAPSVPKPAAAIAKPVLKQGGGYYQDDGPGDSPPSAEFLAAIANAEPRLEPLHRFANKPYSVLGRDYIPLTTLAPYKARGVGSWYGRKFHGQKTSSGEIYDMYGMSAAHATLPIPSYVRVSNPANGNSVIVRVNDRGPFHAGRLIDLSYAAAWKLGYVGNGSAIVEVESILPGDSQYAARRPPPAEAEDPLSRLILQAQQQSRQADTRLSEMKDARGVFLQLGAFSNPDNAENLKSRLSRELAGLTQAGEAGEKLQVQARGGVYRVQFGPWRDHQEAQQMAERLREKFELQTVVVRQ